MMVRKRLRTLILTVTALVLALPVLSPVVAQSEESAFIEAVTQQTGDWDTSYGEFSGYRLRLAEEPAETEAYMLLVAMDEEATSWGDVPDAVAEISAPASCAATGDALTAWGTDINDLYEAWRPIARFESEERWQAFDEQVTTVEESRAVLETTLSDCRTLAGVEVETSATAQVEVSDDPRSGTWGDAATGIGGNRAATPEPSVEIEGDLYVLPTSGAEVVIGSEITLDEVPAGEVPDQLVFETEIGLGAVGALENVGNAEAVLSLYVRSFGESMDSVEEIHREASGKVATGVYKVEASGAELLMFIRVDAESIPGYQVIEVFIAPAMYFERELEVVQTSVSIDGRPLLAGVDGAEIVKLYEDAEP